MTLRMHEISAYILWCTKDMYESVHNATASRPEQTRNDTCWNTSSFTFCRSTTVGRVVVQLFKVNLLFYRRDPANFPDPNVYDPERFSPEQKDLRHKSAFM